MKSIVKVSLFVEVLGLFAVSKSIAFDKSIQISDLSGCREIRLNGKNNHRINFPIQSMLNNQARIGENLRMKFYAIGYDFDIFFKYSDTSTCYISANINGLERKSCKLVYTYYNPTQVLDSVNCSNLTNSFDYSEFTLIIGSSKFLN